MPPEAKKFLFDMQRAGTNIQQFVTGKLVHGYDSVRDDVVWGVIETNLGHLEIELASLLS